MGDRIYTPPDETDGPIDVTITATDTQGLTATITFTVTALDFAPQLDRTGADSVDEGSPYTITLEDVFDGGGFVDLGGEVSQCIVHWGDGSSDTYTTLGDKTHIYADGPATRDVTFDLVDDDGTHFDVDGSDDNPPVTVKNVPPTASITGAPASGHSPEGTDIILGSTVTDPSSVDTAAGFTYAWSVTKNGSAYAAGSSPAFSFTPDGNGTYVVTIGATDKDGGAGSDTKTIIADQVAQAITFGTLANDTYGASFTLSATASSNLPVSLVVQSGPATLSGNVLTVTGVGTVVVEATQAGNASYLAAAPVDRSFVASPATLMVTANPQTKVYGSADPTLTYAASGFWFTDTAATVLNGILTRAAGETVAGRLYAITIGSLATKTTNYTIAFTGNSLAIAPASTKVSLSSSASPVLPGQSVTFTAIVSPVSPGGGTPTGSLTFKNGSTVLATMSLMVVGSQVQASLTTVFSAAGSPTITASYANTDGNYTASSASLTQAVQQVAVEPDPFNPSLTDLFIGSNGASSNDQVQVNPAGSSNTGSTGVKVQTTLSGVNTQTTYSQPFSTIYVFLQGGNDNVQLAATLTIGAVVSAGNGNDTVALGNGNNTVTLGTGNDTIQAGNGTNTVTAGAVGYKGNTQVQLGNGNNNSVTLLGNGNENVQVGNGNNDSVSITGNGNENVQVGNGNNTVTVGNGNDNVQAGNGNNVVVEGTGNDNVQAGDGNNLIVGGLGKHTIQVGKGRNILIDGSAQLTQSNDSLAQVLSDWTQSGSAAANVASIRLRLNLTFNSSNANTLQAGSGLDWFFETYSKNHTNRKASDLHN